MALDKKTENAIDRQVNKPPTKQHVRFLYLCVWVLCGLVAVGFPVLFAFYRSAKNEVITVTADCGAKCDQEKEALAQYYRRNDSVRHVAEMTRMDRQLEQSRQDAEAAQFRFDKQMANIERKTEKVTSTIKKIPAEISKLKGHGN